MPCLENSLVLQFIWKAAEDLTCAFKSVGQGSITEAAVSAEAKSFLQFKPKWPTRAVAEMWDHRRYIIPIEENICNPGLNCEVLVAF